MSLIILKVWTTSLFMAWLLAGIPCSAQSKASPKFQETAFIPFFHKKDPQLVHFDSFYRKDLDGTHTLLMIRAGQNPLYGSNYFGVVEGEWLGLFVVKPDDPDWVRDLTFFRSSDQFNSVTVERVDDRSIVFHRYDSPLGPSYEIKLFFDINSRQLLKQVEYSSLDVERILAFNDKLYFVVGSPHYFAVNKVRQKWEHKITVRLDGDRPVALGGTERDTLLARDRKEPMLQRPRYLTSAEFLEAPREYRPFGNQGLFTAIVTVRSRGHVFQTVEGIAEKVGDDYKLHKLPNSTLEELVRADPINEESYRSMQYQYILDEGIGPYEIVGNRLWFGKTFLIEPGYAGTGGFGYFDPDERRYVLFRPPPIVHTSVSALLVEEKDVWLGLESRGEIESYSEGLMRYDRNTGQVEKFQLSQYEMITQIKRWRDALYLATRHGLLILRDNQLVHYTFEPSITGAIEAYKISR